MAETTAAPTVRAASVPHPLVTAVAGEWLISRTDAPLIGLTRGRQSLFVDAMRDGLGVRFVTDRGARVTFPFLVAVNAAHAEWVAESSRRDAPTVPAVQVSVAVRHRPDASTRLGRTVELLGETLHGGSPVAWGVAEPATTRWDRGRLTAAARDRAPLDTRFIVAGGADSPFAATIRVSRSPRGLVEETKLLAPTPDVTRADDALRAVAETQTALFGTAFATRSGPDATVAPLTELPTPIAVLLGARAAADAGDALAAARPHATLEWLGSGRTRTALLRPRAGGSARQAVGSFVAAVHALGHDAVSRMLGVNPEASRDS